MPARRKITVFLALAALLLGAGCGGNDNLPFTAETDDAIYQQGKQLQRQGRNPEALSAFLKVIERRGEQNAPESHLEVGLLLQRQDPLAAIYHFRKYRELLPNSKEAPKVRGLIDSATREFARTLPAHPEENQAAWLDLRGQIERLQRENDELKDRLDTRRGAAPPSFVRLSQTTTADAARPPPLPSASAITIDDSPVSLAPLPARPPPDSPLLAKVPASAKPATPAKSAGRKHTVAQGENLYNIGKKYGVKPEDIVAANREVVPSVTSPLRLGAELKIP